ncbi:hypothetical protein LTR49_028650, partial [Elasticomyces elasticus]
VRSVTYREASDRPGIEVDTLSNRFEFLELQQPIGGEEHDSKERSGRSHTVVIQEDVFIYFCFLLDCYRIRKQVKLIWEQYRGREISITVAALTTNIALDNVRRLFDRLVVVTGTAPSYEFLEKILLDDGRHCQIEKLPHDVIQEPLPGHEAYNVLSHYAQGYAMGSFRDYHPEDEMFELNSAGPKSYNITKLLARCIPDILSFGLMTDTEQDPVDELTSAIKEVYYCRQITVPLTCRL